MAEQAQNKTDLEKLESSPKALLVKGLNLKYPISSGRHNDYQHGIGVAVGGVGHSANDIGITSASYDYICSVELDLGNFEHLLDEFAFFLRAHLTKKGQQRISAKKYRPPLNMLLANLRRAHLEGNGLSVPTGRRRVKWNNPENIGYTLVNKILDYLSVKGLIKLKRGKGHAQEEKRITTTCWPTAELILWFETNKIKPLLHDRAELIELRKKKISHSTKIEDKTIPIDGKWQTIKQEKRVKVVTSIRVSIPKKDKAKADQLAQTVRTYNEVWLNHIATLDGGYIVPWCKRIFNESLDYGGRFYGSFQQLPKEQRSRILIDGLSTIEPDYSGYHINLLYTRQGAQLQGEPYDIAGYDMAVIKAVMLPLLNSENLAQLASNVTRSAKPELKQWHEKWQRKQAHYTKRRALGIRATRPDKPDYLNGFIEGIPEHTNGKQVIEAIKNKHPLIAHYFGTKNIGVRLQKQDSEIMAAVLSKLALHGIPALPIHDSIRVKSIDGLHAAEIMKSEYQRITGFTINVKNTNH